MIFKKDLQATRLIAVNSKIHLASFRLLQLTLVTFSIHTSESVLLYVLLISTWYLY